MPRQRPGSVTTAAVLTIVYGILFTLCSLCGLIGLAAQGAMNKNLFGGGDPQQAQMQKQIEDAMERDVPLYRAMQVTAPIVGLVFALAILGAGFGLLGMQPWARLLAIGTALLTVLFNVFQTIYQLVFLIPAMNRAIGDALPNAMAKGPAPPPVDLTQVVKVSLLAGVAIGVLIQVAVIVYLLTIVFLLMRRNVRAAFAGADLPEVAGGLPDRDAEDEGWGQGQSVPR
jgi:hypothetical protein